VTAGEVLRGELVAARDALTEHETLQTELARVQADGETLLADITRREASNAALAQQQVAFEQARATQVAHQETLALCEAAQRTHQHALDAITAFGDEPAVDEDTITAARERETTARGELAAATDVVREARARLAATQRTIATAEQAVHAAETSEAARSDAAARLRLAVSTRDALTSFREQRLAALAPALQDAASDHVNTLSGGRFTAIELTDDFDTVVVDSDGHARPVAMLSGGEESLVALALRLAIGDEIADGAPGSLLVLDEVLGAMDEDRRVLIVEALRRLDRQVVMVDHHGTPGDVVVLVDAGAASISAT
jgi:exonuclease SbcC